MKSCPDCNRTFEDTMTFCLVDGAILSAPFDPAAKQRTAVSGNTDPAQTEIMHPAPNAPDQTLPSQADNKRMPVPRTIASPTPIPRPQAETTSPLAKEYSSKEEIAPQSAMKTMKAPLPEVMVRNNQRATVPGGQLTQIRPAGSKRLTLIAGVLFVLIIIAGIVWLILAKTGKESPGTAQSNQAQPAKLTETKPPPTGQSFTENLNGIQIQMVAVPTGKFLMGSPLAETGRDNDEGPQNDTTVQSFDMSNYEVTQAQYKAVMGANPSSFKGDELPVDSVSWNDAVEFCRKLSQMTGHDYRLPTEAEWEYASRAGTSGPYAGKLDAMTWYGANSGNQTHPVGQKQPNGFGLYDMYGNVWEWCQSKYKPYPYLANDGREDLQGTDVRVLRGGSWQSSASSCRSAYRRRVIPDLRSVGFRVVLAAR